jgi:aldehyde dehydrogenase (NAD+)
MANGATGDRIAVMTRLADSLRARMDEMAELVTLQVGSYGLHGAVFTRDHARAMRVAAAVDSGTFTIDRYVTNTAAPYGGVKGSGYGREHGGEGISEFLEFRTINDPLG